MTQHAHGSLLKSLAVIFGLLGSTNLLFADGIYFRDQGGLYRADLDGQNSEFVFSMSLDARIVVDHANQTLYFATPAYNSASLPIGIHRINTDGTGHEAVFTASTDGPPFSAPYALAIDSVHEKLYWSDVSLNTISRSNLDGSNIEAVASLGSHPQQYPADLAIDPVGGKIYWATTPDSGAGRIVRANLDGSSVEEILHATFLSRFGIAIDPGDAKIYFSRSLGGGSAGTAPNAQIQRANLDGTNVEDVLVDLNFFDDSYSDLELDLASRKIYWNTRFRANMDGTGYEELPLPDSVRFTLDVTPVPEPSTFATLVAALVTCFAWRRRR